MSAARKFDPWHGGGRWFGRWLGRAAVAVERGAIKVQDWAAWLQWAEPSRPAEHEQGHR